MQIRSLSSFKNSLQQQCQLQLQFATLPPPPQLIFAVMASPEVLKKAGRNYLDTPEQMNLVELMCEFVEAMNPGLTLSKKPQILKDRDLTGELKDIWSAVQNFRDKEKAGVSDIVVYTEFGPESAASPPLRPSIDIFAPSDHSHHSQQQQSQQNCENNGHIDELESTENSINIDENNELHPRNDDINVVDECETTNGKSSNKSSGENDEENNAVVVIEKLSLGDNCAGSKKSKNSNSNNFNNENETSEKLVKVQNQKNKESHQHHFFPKFLTSSKDKDKDKDKDTKEKEKEKDESSQETKVKTKKSLNFFRRNKTTSSTSSPTHVAAATTTTSSNQQQQQQKSDAE